MKTAHMEKLPYLSVVIPAYNEAKRLPLTLIDIDKHLSAAPFEYEILVVDNNSTDATRDITNRFATFIKNLRLIECKTQGKGAAVKKGMTEAKGQIRLFSDADNATSVDHFFKMEHYFKEGYDVVIASRDIEGSKLVPPQPWYKRVLGDMGNLYIQMLLLKGIKDTQCGFKAFTARASGMVFPMLTVVGWGFDVEALTAAKRLGFRIKEVPVTWVNNFESKVKLSSYLHVLLEVLSIKLKAMRGTYDRPSTPRREH